jgi:hypothetical protein
VRPAQPGIRRGQDDRHDGPASARDRSCRSARVGDVPAISDAACLAGRRRNARQADFGIQTVPIGEPKGISPPGRLAVALLPDERRPRQDLPPTEPSTGTGVTRGAPTAWRTAAMSPPRCWPPWARSGSRCAPLPQRRAGADDQGDVAGVRMPGVTRRGALIATASPAAGSLNATTADVPACRPGRLRPVAAAALPGRPAGIWDRGVR